MQAAPHAPAAPHLKADCKLDVVVAVVGGGVSAAHFVSELLGLHANADGYESTKPLCLVVSAEPRNLAPYDRTVLSKDSKGLKAALSSDGAGFQWVKGSFDGAVQTPDWYAAKVDFIYGSVVFDCNLNYRRLTLRDYETGRITEVTYEKLVIATGGRAKLLHDADADDFAASLWDKAHADLEARPPPADESEAADAALERGAAAVGAEADGVLKPWLLAPKDGCRLGFGSVHHLRNVGDAVKLAHAAAANEVDGQETSVLPVVVVGGGLLTMELAATLAKFREDKIPVTIVLSRDRLLPALFSPDDDATDAAQRAEDAGSDAKAVAEFYERQLVKVGVRFVREHRCVRLWAPDDDGEFPTLEGPAVSLQRTRPRKFDREPFFSECRGVVLANRHGGALSWLAARFVVLCLGTVANTQVFQRALKLSPKDQSVLVDHGLRASHATGDVFAIGDVATFPLPRSNDSLVRLQHEPNAIETARHCARTVAADLRGDKPFTAPFDPMPHVHSRFLDCRLDLHGRCDGVVVALGLAEYATTRVFGAFWVLENRVVGALLEGGSDSQRAACRQIAFDEPLISKLQRFRRLTLQEFLDNPNCLQPPQLKAGEFLAEVDSECVSEAFSKYDSAKDGTAKMDKMGDLMRDLGADWDAEEEAEALRALDPFSTNAVSLEDFKAWWIH
ncbi:hypothetical protein M885DRAFT_514280 [Pelagophyceae sp. CCMP2097]|nr:hypothetical protein M885DRAFT_514280 [Pelagophyceae sp. CCMP2097]